MTFACDHVLVASKEVFLHVVLFVVSVPSLPITADFAPEAAISSIEDYQNITELNNALVNQYPSVLNRFASSQRIYCSHLFSAR